MLYYREWTKAMIQFSIRRIMALTAYCAATIVAIADPLFETTIWRTPVWLGPAAIFGLPFFAWLVLSGNRRHWLRFAQAAAFATCGMVLGVLFFESPLPGALVGLLAAGVLNHALSNTGETDRRKIVVGFCVVIACVIAVSAGLTWRHRLAEYAIRQSGGKVSWRPQTLRVMPSHTRIIASALGPYLVPSDTYVSLRDETVKRQRVQRAALKGLWPHVKAIHGLDHLDVTSRKFGDDDAMQLVGLTSLTHLNLRNTRLADVSPFAGLTSLQRLSLRGAQVRNVAPLVDLTDLEELNLIGTQISDIKPLSSLTSLRVVYLADTPVSDLSALAGLPKLEWLWLENTQVADVTPLSRVSTLQGLFLGNTPVDDLTPLSGLINLRTLNLRGTQVSKASIENLQQTLPRCRMKY